MNVGIATGPGILMPDFSLMPDRPARQGKPFGLFAMVGPIGSGKTLLAVHFARAYGGGRAECNCGQKDCPGRFKVYTNMRSTWGPGGWAEPLDVAGQMLDSGANFDHAVMVLDEAYAYFDSRRATRAENIMFGNFTYQLRKSSMRLFMTAVSIDAIESRVRGMTSKIYSCWTSNGGITVNAAVFDRQQGHLPPWKRHSNPVFRKWWTGADRGTYDTYERIDASESSGWRAEPTVFQEIDGEYYAVPLTAFLNGLIGDLVRAGTRDVSPEQLAEELTNRTDVPVSVGHVRRYLNKTGFPRRPGLHEERYMLAARRRAKGATV